MVKSQKAAMSMYVRNRQKPNCMSLHSHDIVEISKSNPNNLVFFIFKVFLCDISLFLTSIISILHQWLIIIYVVA